jgi:ATP-dependent DNA ligase
VGTCASQLYFSLVLEAAPKTKIVMVAFDLLYLNGDDLRKLPR